MPESGEIDVAHVARLARLNLTEEETKLFQGQLRRVLEYAQKLQKAHDAAAAVSPTEVSEKSAGETPAAPTDVLRADEARSWFTAEEALASAPREANGLFIVPKVVE
jgi:aspartyl-tRNA(Asn)/glutamyl-tRNA(Gln) amidotransferase subunit C